MFTYLVFVTYMDVQDSGVANPDAGKKRGSEMSCTRPEQIQIRTLIEEN